METKYTVEDRKQIREGIRGKYVKVSLNPKGLFQYPTGQAGLEELKYDRDVVQALPETAVASYCGVGNPFSLGPIHRGEAVLDIGCGGGVDTLVAAMMVGPTGRVVDIDMIPEMLALTTKNLQEMRLKNVTLEESSAEGLPFPDESFHVVISNGVFNLVPDKARSLEGVFRVLKPGERLMIADQVLVGELPEDTKARVDSWAKWQGGAIPGKDFLDLFKQVGFEDAQLVGETGFNSSSVTKGALFRATKPVISSKKKVSHAW